MRVNPTQGVEFANSLIQDDDPLADLNQVYRCVVVCLFVYLCLLLLLLFADSGRVR